MLKFLLPIILVLLPSFARAGPTTMPATTVILVRHAEKADGLDPGLKSHGEARAKALARVVGDAGIVAIFVTTTHRTLKTAEPTAELLKIEPQIAPADEAFFQLLRTKYGGKTVLVVGHSFTLHDTMTRGLHLPESTVGAATADITTRSDNLFICTIDDTSSSLVRLRYGEAN